MKIVVLTNNGSLFGKKILNDLISHKIEIEAIVVIRQPLKYYWKLFQHVLKRIGFIDTLYFSLKRFLIKEKEQQPNILNNKLFVRSYDEMGPPIFFTHGTNSEKTLDMVRDISPDILILGQTGIVDNKLLKIPKIGTLNAHPGILPYYRGIDCAKWACYNNEFHKIGASVHWVDKGIDTGNIITKQTYDFIGNETLDILENKLYDLCVSMLTKVVSSVQKGKIVHGETQNKTEWKLYFKMPRGFERFAKKNLLAFLMQRKKDFNCNSA